MGRNNTSYGLVSFFFVYGELFVATIGTMYVGYDATIVGSLIGGAFAFVCAFICGIIFAWLYNLFVRLLS
jgi:hypothetical protein